MKLSGDVSIEDREIAEQLIFFESEIELYDVYPANAKAQLYVCLAHDWYQLNVEEEGNRLLLKAEKVCPGYFKNEVIQQQKDDEDFDRLVKNITIKLVSLLADTVGSN